MFTYMCIFIYIYQHLCLLAYYVYPSTYLPTYPSIYLSAYLYLCIHLSIHQHTYIHTYLSIHIYIYYTYIYIYIYTPLYLFIGSKKHEQDPRWPAPLRCSAPRRTLLARTPLSLDLQVTPRYDLRLPVEIWHDPIYNILPQSSGFWWHSRVIWDLCPKQGLK